MFPIKEVKKILPWLPNDVITRNICIIFQELNQMNKKKIKSILISERKKGELRLEAIFDDFAFERRYIQCKRTQFHPVYIRSPLYFKG